MRLGANDQSMDVEAISTGSLGLDIALGIGGLPRGRVIEIYGPEVVRQDHARAARRSPRRRRPAASAASSTPSTRSIPPTRGKLGVKVDDLLISQPDTGEQALEIAEMLVRSGAIDVIVIDSVAALVPKAEIEGEMGDMHLGLQARLMSQALRKLTGVDLASPSTMVIFINQIRMKIGVMFGNPETTTGGNALKFYASVRLDIRRIGAIKERRGGRRQPDARQGRQEQGRPAVQQVEFDIMYGEGISKSGELVDLGVEGEHRREVGRLVLLRRPAHRAGPREHQGVLEGEPRDRGRHREGDPRQCRAHRR